VTVTVVAVVAGAVVLGTVVLGTVVVAPVLVVVASGDGLVVVTGMGGRPDPLVRLAVVLRPELDARGDRSARPAAAGIEGTTAAAKRSGRRPGLDRRPPPGTDAARCAVDDPTRVCFADARGAASADEPPPSAETVKYPPRARATAASPLHTASRSGYV
jgi:hypothetical protein